MPRPLKAACFAVVLLLLSTTSMLLGQTPAQALDEAPPSSTEPLIVDVHPSPYRSAISTDINIGDQRLDMRDVTLFRMIALAYNHERQLDSILGGPAWIDFDRFDLAAKIPPLKAQYPNSNPANAASSPANSYDRIRPVLQRVLSERFHLKTHMESRPMPGYVMSLAKGGAKLVETKDPDAASACPAELDKSNGQYIVTCTSETMAQFLSTYGGIFPHPVLDRTGLTKSYDFTFRVPIGQSQTPGVYIVRTQEDSIHLYVDAFSKQLGLVVTPGDVPQPVMFVDSVDRTPTPNATDIAKLIPAPRDLEFEVATIKPAAGSEQEMIRPIGSQITFTKVSMQELLVMAWQLPTGAMLGNAPPWLDRVRYTILVKLPPEMDARSVFQDQDLFDRMLQKLLVDRFQIKYHWGEQVQDGWVLLAGNPKMKKADPNSRSYCKGGQPDGEKDMRTAADSPYDREFHCQNVTMDQFVDLAQNMAGTEIKNRVPNKTGLAGSYDFTLYYTTGHKIRVDTAAAGAAAKEAGEATAAPVEAVSLEDAFRKQLGLRLERQSNSFPALVLDHIEQTPTEN